MLVTMLGGVRIDRHAADRVEYGFRRCCSVTVTVIMAMRMIVRGLIHRLSRLEIYTP